MVLLIHHPVSAASRKVRIIMAEKRMLFVLKEEEPWKPSQDLYKLNPSGEVPVFVFDGNVIAGNYAITEFLEEVNREIRLMPADPKQKAEVRRLIEWFDVKFMREVNRNIVYEKVHKRFGFGNPPDSKILKIGINNLNFHLEYIDWLAERRNYLAGDDFSLADITAAKSKPNMEEIIEQRLKESAKPREKETGKIRRSIQEKISASEKK